MLKILLPIIAFIAVLAGLIAAEPPLTQAQLDQKYAQEKMLEIEQKAEEWVRIAYNLTPDALPAGYLARILWTADKTAITKTAKTLTFWIITFAFIELSFLLKTSYLYFLFLLL